MLTPSEKGSRHTAFLGGGVGLAFLLLQLARPSIPNPPVATDLNLPANVKQILRNSCFDCHSNETRLSWFDQVVPAYWLVASDVRKARRHLNISELGARSAAEQRAALFEAVNFIRVGRMPLDSYKRLHPQAAITSDQLSVLEDYLTPKSSLVHSQKDVEAADLEYRKWATGYTRSTDVKPSPNGIEFLPDYKNWRVISSTTRFDANTMRVILGNDVAVKAIFDGNTNPWPDGTTFAKVGWHQLPDQNGVVRAGAFLKVGFMIKDKKKYASTAGWGWAEWVGTDLRPAGESPDFANECVTCHAPLRKNDYVYTIPIPRPGSSK